MSFSRPISRHGLVAVNNTPIAPTAPTGTIRRMSAGTKKRPIRMPDELWEAAQAKAEKAETNVSAVIRDLLTEWVQDPH